MGTHRPARRALGALLTVVVVVALGGLTGCGGSDERAGDDSPRRDATAPTAGAYEGLTKQAAIAKADAADVTWRITREDDERFLVTQDLQPDRVNFEIDDGRVTRVSFG
jgi:major membrane immunogen (membrane-anchored lipoprotein)